MPFPFTCPKCGTHGNAADWFAGKQGKCACGSVLDFTAQAANPSLKVGRLEKGEIVDRRTGLDRRIRQLPNMPVQRRSGKERRQGWGTQGRPAAILGQTRPAEDLPSAPSNAVPAKNRGPLGIVFWLITALIAVAGTPIFLWLFFGEKDPRRQLTTGVVFLAALMVPYILAQVLERIARR